MVRFGPMLDLSWRSVRICALPAVACLSAIAAPACNRVLGIDEGHARGTPAYGVEDASSDEGRAPESGADRPEESAEVGLSDGQLDTLDSVDSGLDGVQDADATTATDVGTGLPDGEIDSLEAAGDVNVPDAWPDGLDAQQGPDSLDAPVIDVGPSCDPLQGDSSPEGCISGDVSGFVPLSNPPYKPHQDACTELEIATYVPACFDMADPDFDLVYCVLFANNAEPCFLCLETLETSTPWGAVVVQPGAKTANVAGCMRLLDPSSASCAQKLTNAFACLDLACGSCDEEEARVQCKETASQCGCREYWNAWALCEQEMTNREPPSPATQCLQFDSYGTLATAVGSAFCGAE